MMSAPLRLVVLIVSIGQHALMQDAKNQNTTTLLAEEYDVLAMLMRAHARARPRTCCWLPQADKGVYFALVRNLV
jgi:hypothetical protein